MKNLIRLSVYAILIAMFSSCASHYGFMNNSASLNKANFSYLQRNVSGTAQTVKIFGFGGLGDDGLVEKAKLDMLVKSELQSNQALVNVTVDWRNSWMCFVRTTKCTVTADIVEFNSNSIPDLISAIPAE